MCLGETWVFTECGMVTSQLAISIFGIAFLMFMLWLILEVKVNRTDLKVHVPVNACEWYKFGMKARYQDVTANVNEEDAEYKRLESDKCDVVLLEDSNYSKSTDWVRPISPVSSENENEEAYTVKQSK